LDTTAKNKRALRKLWFKEHKRILFPLFFLIIGLVAGAVLSFGYAQIHFSHRQAQYEQNIQNLGAQISSLQKTAAAYADSVGIFTQKQDSVIQLLRIQEGNLRKIITFTRRLVTNSTITPKSIDQQEYFRRNVRYLIRLYDQNFQKLQKMGVSVPANYNLKTIPDFLNE